LSSGEFFLETRPEPAFRTMETAKTENCLTGDSTGRRYVIRTFAERERTPFEVQFVFYDEQGKSRTVPECRETNIAQTITLTRDKRAVPLKIANGN